MQEEETEMAQMAVVWHNVHQFLEELDLKRLVDRWDEKYCCWKKLSVKSF